MTHTEQSMAEKICLVTGATSGIGKATAMGLARRGATVIAAGRNREKCEYTVKQIQSVTGNDRVDYLVGDLSSQKEIRLLTKQMHARYPHLDVLINNAGAKFASRRQTVDGYEMSFALNHLSGFMLTYLLLGLLKKNGGARIVNVSSGAHKTCPGIRFDDLQGKKSYYGKHAYAQSKLAGILFTYSLARRLQGTGITVNAVHPGGAATGFCKNNGTTGWLKHLLAHILAGNLITPTAAAQTILHLAASSEVQGVTGKYFVRQKPVPSSPASYDADAAERLWDISLELTNISKWKKI
jgi:NAD(P)-dependent dehydrogenase (short-subunit alcohol dehydrogenase family)